MNLKKLLAASALLLPLCKLSAQITITSADMPNLNDNILISVNTSLANFHPDSTGANFLWDYSNLIPDSQRYVNFVSATTTPYTFLAFNSTYGVRNYTPDAIPWSLIGSPPTNVYDFYKKSGSDYKQVDQGLTEAGAALPIPFQAADRVYSFPMHYLGKDSSNSAFAFPIPNTGYYAKKQKRVNNVDGWGVLKTPYGTFNALRIKSILTISDSIYIDTVHFGFTIPRAIQYEYKWFSAGSKIPMLEIDATAATGNNVTVTRVNWQDSAFVINFTDQSSCPLVNEGSITANVTGGKRPLNYLWNTGQTTQTISNLLPGMYSVTVTDANGRTAHGADSVKVLQDSSCVINIKLVATKTCPMAKNGALVATQTGGRNPVKYLWSNGDTTNAINNLATGNYDLTVTDKYGRQATATGMVEGYTQDLSCLNIPSAFTPDGDGTNDTWVIRSLSEYSNCKVEIYNQWGSVVFKSTGYGTPWNGKYNGEAVPAGAYYYIINLEDGSNTYKGTVTIVK
ncbi:MAG: gliding motility-associated C-terminal domain-containing protein [Bacteroidia bacterium]